MNSPKLSPLRELKGRFCIPVAAVCIIMAFESCHPKILTTKDPDFRPRIQSTDLSGQEVTIHYDRNRFQRQLTQTLVPAFQRYFDMNPVEFKGTESKIVVDPKLLMNIRSEERRLFIDIKVPTVINSTILKGLFEDSAKKLTAIDLSMTVEFSSENGIFRMRSDINSMNFEDTQTLGPYVIDFNQVVEIGTLRSELELASDRILGELVNLDQSVQNLSYIPMLESSEMFVRMAPKTYAVNNIIVTENTTDIILQIESVFLLSPQRSIISSANLGSAVARKGLSYSSELSLHPLTLKIQAGQLKSEIKSKLMKEINIEDVNLKQYDSTLLVRLYVQTRRARGPIDFQANLSYGNGKLRFKSVALTEKSRYEVQEKLPTLNIDRLISQLSSISIPAIPLAQSPSMTSALIYFQPTAGRESRAYVANVGEDIDLVTFEYGVFRMEVYEK